MKNIVCSYLFIVLPLLFIVTGTKYHYLTSMSFFWLLMAYCFLSPFNFRNKIDRSHKIKILVKFHTMLELEIF